MAWRGLAGAGVIQQLQLVIGLGLSAKARRAEEDHRILNLLPAEARKRLQVFGNDADQAAVGAVQKRRILIGQRRLVERNRRRVALRDRLVPCRQRFRRRRSESQIRALYRFHGRRPLLDGESSP